MEHVPVLTDLSQVIAYYSTDDEGVADVPWLVAILLRFAEATLLVEVDPETDEAVLRVEHQAELQHWRDESAPRDLTDHAHWAALIGSNVAWRWQLTNQQGYRDGVQIELNREGTSTTRQWVATASRLHEAAVDTAV